MQSKRANILFLLSMFAMVLLTAGCGSGSSQSPSSGEAAPEFSMPLPKGLGAPLPHSDLILTAQAILDPGTAAARTVDLTVDLATNRVSGVIAGVPAGPHVVVIQYFINGVGAATATLDVSVLPGQNNPVEISPALIQYVETVSDTLFVARGAAVEIIERASALPAGRAPAAPTRVLQGSHTGLSAPAPGGLFADPLGGGLYVTIAPAHAVAVWNNAAAVNGDVPPDRLLAGPSTLLNRPTGVAVDPFRRRLYVVNQGGEILIWENSPSLTGNAPPIAAVFPGPLSGLTGGDHPVYLDVKSDTLFVANGAEVRLFKELSQRVGNQDVAPVGIIRVAGKGLSQAGLAGDPGRDRLYISSHDPNGTIYAITAPTAASGAVAPAATLAGPETGLDQTAALAAANNLLMALNQGGSEIRIWRPADQKDGAAPPTQILEWSSPAPVALFYVGTQNENQNPQATLDVTKRGTGQGGVISDPAGINCGATCSSLFPVGARVTLTAAAEAGAAFTGWSGACSGAIPICTLMTDADKQVTATFDLVTTTTTTAQPTTTTTSTTMTTTQPIPSTTTTSTTTTEPTTTTAEPTTTTTETTTTTSTTPSITITLPL